MVKVITISGKAGHGKDFSACIIKEKLEAMGKKVAIVHYADYLKFVATKYFNWNGEKDDAGRTLLQWLGTDLARNNLPTIWVDVIIMLIKAIFIDYDYVIIADCRFPNEVERLEEKGLDVFAVKIVRIAYTNNLTEEQQKHPSETALDNFEFDYIMMAMSGREHVEKSVDLLVRDFIL